MASFQATGQITLTSVLDGFMIELSPSRFIIPTDENGKGINSYQGTGTCSLVTRDGKINLNSEMNVSITELSWIQLGENGTYIIDLAKSDIDNLNDTGTAEITVIYSGLTRKEYIYYEKAKQGITGEKGEDALTVTLSNEYQMVPVDFDGLALEDSFITEIQVYRGNDLIKYKKIGSTSYPYYTLTSAANTSDETLIDFIDNTDNVYYAAAKIYTRKLNNKVRELLYPLVVTCYINSDKTISKTCYVRLRAATNTTKSTIKMVFNSSNYYKFYNDINPSDSSDVSYGYTPSSIQVGITYQEDGGATKKYTLPSTSDGDNYSGYKIGFYGIIDGEWQRIPDTNIIYDATNQTYYIPFSSLDEKKLWDRESIKAVILYKTDNTSTEEVILQEETKTLAYGTQEQAARFNFLMSGAYWDVNGLNYSFDDEGLKITKRNEIGTDEEGNPTYETKELFTTRDGNLTISNVLTAREGNIGNWKINNIGMISSDDTKPAGVFAPEGTVYYDYQTIGDSAIKEDFFNQYLTTNEKYTGNPIQFELKQNLTDINATIEIIPEQLGTGLPSTSNYRRIIVVGNGENWEKEYLDVNQFSYNDGEIGYEGDESVPAFVQQDDDGYIYSNGTIIVTLNGTSIISAYKWVMSTEENSSIDVHVDNLKDNTSNTYNYNVSNFYGGSLDIKEKKIYKEWIEKKIVSLNDYSYDSNSQSIIISLQRPISSSSRVIFSHGAYGTSTNLDTCYVMNNNIVIYLNNLEDKTKEGYDNYIEQQSNIGAPLTIYYKVQNPEEVVLTNAQLLSLSLGANSVYTNGSSIELNVISQKKAFSEYKGSEYDSLMQVTDNTGLVFYAGQQIPNRLGILNKHSFKTNRTYAFSVLGNGLIYAQSLIADGTIYSNNAINIIGENKKTGVIDLEKHILGNTSITYKGFNGEEENIFLGVNHIDDQNAEVPYSLAVAENGKLYAGAGMICLSSAGLFLKKNNVSWFSGISTNSDGNYGYPSFWVQTTAESIINIGQANTKFLIDKDGLVFSANSYTQTAKVENLNANRINFYSEEEKRFEFNAVSFKVSYDEDKKTYITQLLTSLSVGQEANIQSGSIFLQPNTIIGNSFLIDDNAHFARYDTIRATNLETINFVKEKVNTVNGSLLLTNSARVSSAGDSFIILDNDEATMEVGYTFGVNEGVNRARYYVTEKEIINNTTKYTYASLDKTEGYGNITFSTDSLVQIYGGPSTTVTIEIDENKGITMKCDSIQKMLTVMEAVGAERLKVNGFEMIPDPETATYSTSTKCKLSEDENFNEFIGSLEKDLKEDNIYTGIALISSAPELPSFSKIYLKTNKRNPEITLFSSSSVERLDDDNLDRIETTKANNLTLRIGNLSTIKDDTFGGQLNGNGLYSENAYLKGSLVLPRAGILNSSLEENIFNFKSWNDDDDTIGNFPDSPIRIWAGAPVGSRQKAPFVVTEDGSLYASKGVFKGSIYADHGIFKGFLESTGVLLTDDHSMNFFFAKKKTDSNDYGEADYIININENGLEIYDDSFAIFSGKRRTSKKELYYDYLLSEQNPEEMAELEFSYQLPYISTSDAHLSLIEKTNIILDYDLEKSEQVGDALKVYGYGIYQDMRGFSWFDTSQVTMDNENMSSKKWLDINDTALLGKINKYSMQYDREQNALKFGPEGKLNVQIGNGKVHINNSSTVINSIVAVNGGLNFYCDRAVKS